MSSKVLIEVDPQHETFLRRALAFAQEMEQLALSAADGAVFDACEEAVISRGRDLQRLALAQAVQRRIEAAEKKGLPSASVPVAAASRTAGPNNAT